MNKIMVLTKLFLKSFEEDENSNNKKSPLSSMMLSTMILLICLGVPFAVMTSQIYDAAYVSGKQGLILEAIFSLGSIMIFILGITYAMSNLYFSRDIMYILPMPLKQYEILGAKFIVMMLYEYITEIIIFIPSIIVYGINDGFSIISWIQTAAAVILMPVFPLSMAAFIDIMIMSFTGLGKHKDAVKITISILAMSLAIGFSLLMNNMNMAGVSNIDVVNKLSSGITIIDVSSSVFPTGGFAAAALSGSDYVIREKNFLLLIVISAASIIAFLGIGQKFYFKGAAGIIQSSSKYGAVTEKEKRKYIFKSSVFKSYIQKEYKILMRTPIYFLDCILMTFLWPVFVIIPLAIQPDIAGSFSHMADIFFTNGYEGALMGVIVSAMMFLANSNMISSTAISREGRNISFMRYIPMPFSLQLIAKSMVGIIFGLVNMILIVAVEIWLGAPLKFMLCSIILMLLTDTAFNFIGIIFDLRKPKLNWDNEGDAVKQNFNAVFLIFLSLGIAIIHGIAVSSLSLTFIQSFIAEIVLLIIINIIAVYVLLTWGKHRIYEFS